MERTIDSLAAAPKLLVSCAFDGVVAPFAPTPDEALPLPDVLEALHALARLPDTWVAIVGGRPIHDLRARVGDLGPMWLVGTHGAEIAGPGMERQAADLSANLDLILRLAMRVAPASRGFVHERKPASVAVHFRNVEPGEVHRVIPMLTYALAVPAGLRVKRGAMVVEYMAIEADLSRSVELIRCTVGASDVGWIADSYEDATFFSMKSHFIATESGGTHGLVAVRADSTAEVEAPSSASAQQIVLGLHAARERAVGGTASRITGA